MRTRSYTLLELLIAIAIVAILASLLVTAVMRAVHRSRAIIMRNYYWHNYRLELFLNDHTDERNLMLVATNRPSN